MLNAWASVHRISISAHTFREVVLIRHKPTISFLRRLFFFYSLTEFFPTHQIRNPRKAFASGRKKNLILRSTRSIFRIKILALDTGQPTMYKWVQPPKKRSFFFFLL